MRNSVNGRRAAWLFLSLACALPATASGSEGIIEPMPPDEQDSPPQAAAREEQAKDETKRWVPAFSVYSGVLMQNAEGKISSTPLAPERGVLFFPLDCPDWPVGVRDPVRCPTNGDDLMVAPFVGGSIELMTPGLTSLPGRPRLFVHGDAAASFAFTRDVAKEGIPGEFEAPTSPTGESFQIEESAILGQGSRLSAEVKPLLLSAGAGVAFTLDAWERRLRIKPSVEYLREEIEVTGVMHRAVAKIPSPQNDLEDFDLIALSGSKKQSFHGIGPGLEIEADVAGAGPFMLTVYLAGQAYAFLGDLEMEFSDTNEFGETATWSFEKNRWGGRVGVGLRFRWVPK
jgi:hypothetical protein